MKLSKSMPKKYSEVLIAVAAAVFGLLIQPAIESIVNPLFDTATRALLTGFVFLAFILVITSTVIAILIRNHDMQLDRFEDHLIDTRNQVKLSASLSEVGISGAVPRHTETHYDEFCSSATNEISILQTYLGSIRGLPASIFNAANHGVKVRLLLLDPDSQMIRQRLRDIGLPDSVQVHKDAMERVRIIINRYNPLPDMFEVRFYDSIPPFAMYKADNRIRLGFFWHGEHCPVGPHIYVDDSDSVLGRFAISTFDDIWQSSRDANIRS